MPFPFKERGKRLSNWGRWGADDERGTLNFLTPEVTRAATASIRSGRCFELSIPLGSDGPQTGFLRALRQEHPIRERTPRTQDAHASSRAR